MPRPKIVHFGTIKSGKLGLNNSTHFNKSVSENFREGEVVAIELSRPKKIRTLSQNNYLWLYYQVICDETGEESVENLHEYLKRVLLPPNLVKILGKEVRLPASTTELSKSEFSAYIVKIEALTGIVSPDAEKYLYGD